MSTARASFLFTTTTWRPARPRPAQANAAHTHCEFTPVPARRHTVPAQRQIPAKQHGTVLLAVRRASTRRVCLAHVLPRRAKGTVCLRSRRWSSTPWTCWLRGGWRSGRSELLDGGRARRGGAAGGRAPCRAVTAAGGHARGRAAHRSVLRFKRDRFFHIVFPVLVLCVIFLFVYICSAGLPRAPSAAPALQGKRHQILPS